MKGVKMIVSDLDGTLFNSDQENYEVSPRIIDLIEYLNRHGVLFTIATGRPQYSCRTIVKELNLRIPYIAYNGAMILDSEGMVFYNNSFFISLWKDFLERINDLDGTILFYLNENIYYYRYTAAVDIYQKKEKVTCLPFERYWLEEEIEVNKILLIGDNKLYRKEWDNVLSNGMKESYRYVISEHNYLEILKKDVSKGHALRRLKKHLGIPDNGVIGIGNQMNDKELLEESHLGIAVQNAEEELKNIAHMVTKEPYDKGVIEVLEAVAQIYAAEDKCSKMLI